jgi:hypothetical protein
MIDLLPANFDKYGDGSRRRRLFWQAVPAWFVSTLVHTLILLTLALVTVGDPVRVVNVMSAVVSRDEGPEIEQFTIDEVDPGEIPESEPIQTPTSDISQSIAIEPPPAVEPFELATKSLEASEVAAAITAPSLTLQSLSVEMAAPLTSRSQEMRKKLLREYGGTESSEAAVTAALQWLSRHQAPHGGWTFQHNVICNDSCGDPGQQSFWTSYNAATALGLLPFMGAGQTHVEGQFKEVVFRGLRFLIQNADKGTVRGLPVLDLRDKNGTMYSHGLAAIALCEAYAMTGDPELAGPAQWALNFIALAQSNDGGWRYEFQQASGGDTSVTGWMVMALKSGHMGHLVIPPTTITGAMLFLDKVASNSGAWYGYAAQEADLNHSCTAIGLLCRMYTGWDKTHPGIVSGVAAISSAGVNRRDIYYDYYAAQLLRHYGGPEWDKFNTELRDWLVQTQSQRAGEKGSWYFRDSVPHRGPKEGGRLASTALATMILEVYYRHMPLYATSAAEEDFPL